MYTNDGLAEKENREKYSTIIVSKTKPNQTKKANWDKAKIVISRLPEMAQ